MSEKIGFLETEEKGKIVKSSIRIGYFVMLALTFLYVAYSVITYFSTVSELIELMKTAPELKAVALQMMNALKAVDYVLLILLMLSWIAPKAIAKIAENKLK